MNKHVVIAAVLLLTYLTILTLRYVLVRNEFIDNNQRFTGNTSSMSIIGVGIDGSMVIIKHELEIHGTGTTMPVLILVRWFGFGEIVAVI